VNLFKSTFLQGADLWGNICVTADEDDMMNLCVSNMHPDSGVPLDVSVHNALKLGQEAVPCYVLRRELMPTFNEAGEFIADESYCDGRFRGKLHKRHVAGLISLKPMWVPGPTVPPPETFVIGEDEDSMDGDLLLDDPAGMGIDDEPQWYDEFDECGC
jgi:hypothetical protein